MKDNLCDRIPLNKIFVVSMFVHLLLLPILELFTIRFNGYGI